MRKLLFLLLATCGFALANNTCTIALSSSLVTFSSTTAGNWTNCGGVKPQNGDNISVTGGSNRALVLDTAMTFGIGQNPYRAYPAAVTGSAGGGTTCATLPSLGGTSLRAGFMSCKVIAGTCTLLIGDRGYYTATGTTDYSGACSNGAPTYALTWNSGGGTPAILVAGSTRVIFSAAIVARGDVLGVDAYQDSTVAYRWTSGGKLTFDFSLSTNTPVYNLGIQGNSGPPYSRQFDTDGTCTVTTCSITTTGGGVWRMEKANATKGPFIDFENMTLSNIGDASTYALMHTGGNTVGNSFILKNNKIDSASCSHLSSDITDGFTLDIENNVFTNSIVCNQFPSTSGVAPAFGGTFDSTFTTGTRLIAGNVFDIAPWNSANATGLNVKNNFIKGLGITLGGSSGLWTQWSNNAFFFSDVSGTSMNQGPMDHNIFWSLAPTSNWHVFGEVNGKTETINYNIFGTSFANSGDSGELMGIGTLSSTVTFDYNLILADASGLSWAEPGSSPLNTSQKAVTDHNYWYADYGSGTPSFGFFDTNEGANTTSGYIQSMRCNTLWSNHTHNGSVLKIGNILHSPTVTDPASPANADYNWGWGVAATQTSCTGCTGQVHGYAAAWSSSPGAHDNDSIDPGIDYTRRIETFATDYLQVTPTQGVFSALSNYAKGDTVSITTSGKFWGKSIVFTCIVASGCPSSASSTPGVSSNWSTYWEPYTVTWLRTQVGLRSTFVDGALVVTGIGEDTACTASNPCDAITAERHWIQAGHVPSNPLYWGACGPDGAAIGPLDVSGARRLPPSLTVN